MRPRAEFSAIAALSSAVKQESMSVSMAPGATAFTRMPEGPSSLASPLTKDMTAPFVAEYAVSQEPPRTPRMEEVQIMQPRLRSTM